MYDILGLKNLHLGWIDVVDRDFITYDFTFDKTKMKQFEEYLDLSLCDENENQIILKSNVSNFSIFNKGKGAYENTLAFYIGNFDTIFATVPEIIFDKLTELIDNR